jgi:hypothetical protein
MDKQENDQHAYKETTLNDEDHEVFPKGPLGPILGAPKQYEPPRQDGPRSRDTLSEGLSSAAAPQQTGQKLNSR